MKIAKILRMTCFVVSLASCSGGSDPAPSQQASTCLKDAMKVTSTKTEANDSQHTAVLAFDVQNTGAADFDISTGSAPIYFSFKVTTTDGVVYDTQQIMTVTSLKAGATASASQYAEYGATKTYQSLAFSLTCK